MYCNRQFAAFGGAACSVNRIVNDASFKAFAFFHFQKYGIDFSAVNIRFINKCPFINGRLDCSAFGTAGRYSRGYFFFGFRQAFLRKLIVQASGIRHIGKGYIKRTAFCSVGRLGVLIFPESDRRSFIVKFQRFGGGSFYLVSCYIFALKNKLIFSLRRTVEGNINLCARFRNRNFRTSSAALFRRRRIFKTVQEVLRRICIFRHKQHFYFSLSSASAQVNFFIRLIRNVYGFIPF